MHVCINAFMHVCMYACMCVSMYIYIDSTFVQCALSCVSVCIHKHIDTYYIYVYIYICVCIHISDTYSSIHIQ